MILLAAGVIARTVSDVALFNSLFSDCQEAYPDVELKGLRMGYPTNFWADLGDEVSIRPCTDLQMPHSAPLVMQILRHSSVV